MTGDRDDSPIERYLDELFEATSALPPRDARHLLAEAEAHLRDSADAAIDAGLPTPEAERRAVARFGPAETIARADRDRAPTPLAAVARQVVNSALLLGGIGAVAVGASGVLAAVFRAIGGARFLVNAPSADAMSAGCARWTAIFPHAANCAEAAIIDWANETIFYRIALGALGVLALLFIRWTARRSRHRPLLLPRTVSDTIATTAFAVAGVATLALGIEAITRTSGHGAGQWLSAAPIALVGAAWFGVRLVRDLREPAS